MTDRNHDLRTALAILGGFALLALVLGIIGGGWKVWMI